MTLRQDRRHGETLTNDSIQRLEPILRRYLRRRLVDSEVDDIIQETFLGILERNCRSPIKHIDAYVFSVASNAVSKHYRLRARNNKLEQEVFEFLPGEISVTPYRIVSGRESISNLMKSVECLPDRTRSVFRLNRCMDLSYAEISNQLQISTSAVEKHIMKALRVLSTFEEPALPS